MNVVVKLQRVRENSDIPLPEYQTPFSAGVDLRADIHEIIIIKPLKRMLVPTGLAIELPQGYEAQIRARSGLALKNGISLVNGVGTIDTDYRGEIGVILVNLGDEDFSIQRGDRIAQMIIAPVVQATFIDASHLTETQRGAGGFGSTGK